MNILKFLSLAIEDHCIITSDKNYSMNDIQTMFKNNGVESLMNVYLGVNEYNNIDFSDTQIMLERWKTKELIDLPFPNWSECYWLEKINESTLNSFFEWDLMLSNAERDKRLGHWESYGSWATPIIIIESRSFRDCDLKQPFQLFEGHNRLFRLKVIYKHNILKLDDSHLVFVISKKKSL